MESGVVDSAKLRCNYGIYRFYPPPSPLRKGGGIFIFLFDAPRFCELLDSANLPYLMN